MDETQQQDCPLKTFTQAWPKGFRVSPSIPARAPTPPEPLCAGSSATIIHKSSKDRCSPILRRRCCRTSHNVHLAKTQILWFVGLGGFFLFLKRRLHEWFRPEPPKDTKRIVGQSSVAVAVKYIPAGVQVWLMLSPAARSESALVEGKEFPTSWF